MMQDPSPASVSTDSLATPLVVGIGASAGGLEALKSLIPIVPVAGACYVVLQHLSPAQRSMLVEILLPYSPLPVRPLMDGQRPEPDWLLVAPPGHHVEFDGRVLRLRAAEAGQHPVPSINGFFASLARHLCGRTAAILLSGTGSDGAQGLAEIQNAGGAVFFQARESARYRSMPMAALAAVGEKAEYPIPALAKALSQALRVRLRRTGEVAQAAAAGFADLPQRSFNPPAANLEPAVAGFWADEAAVEALEVALRQLLVRKPAHEALRIWIRGCGAGVSASTLAHVCAALLQEERKGRPLHIFATEADLQLLNHARQALAAPAQLEALPDRLRTMWRPTGGSWLQLERGLLEHIAFVSQEVMQEPTGLRLDLVYCRAQVQDLELPERQHLLRHVHHTLRPRGLLLLDRDALFDDASTAWFTRIAAPLPLLQRGDRLTLTPPWQPSRSAGTTEATAASTELQLLRLASSHLPPCVLLDRQLEVQHIHGDVSDFLALQPGLQRHDLLHLAREWIRPALLSLCHRLPAPQQLLHADVSIGKGRLRRSWRIERRDEIHADGQVRILVSFVPRGRPARLNGEFDPAVDTTAQIQQLTLQLEETRAHLQRLGDEAQSANEAMQAGNEELETANEELLATNEELSVVNGELRDQWERYQRLSQELQNIENSVPNALLVLDLAGRLNRFNRAAAELLRLGEQDLGRLPDPRLKEAGLEGVIEQLGHFAASAEPFTGPLPQRPDGRAWILQLSAHVVEQQRLGTIVVLIDNTALVRSERHSRNIEQRLVGMMSHGGALVALRDPGGRFLYANAPYARFFALDIDTLLGRTAFQCLPEAVALQLRAGDGRALGTKGTVEVEESFEIDGRIRHWWVNRFVMNDDDGAAAAVCEQAIDVTAWRSADAELRIAEKVFENSAEGILVTDPQMRIVRVNQAFERTTGYSAEEVIGQRPSILSSGRHDAAFYRQMWTAIRRQDRWQGEIWNQRKDGSVFAELLSISVLRDDQGQISHYVGVFADLTPLIESRNRAEHLATHDALTGLPNRALLMDRLEHALEASTRRRSELALCFIDLDHFKTVNDSLGHGAGDEMLRTAARRIVDHVRHADTVARLGGDEFVLLLENTDRNECLQTVNRVLRALSEPFTLNGTELNTAASIGVAFYPGDGQDVSTLMQHADAAMYRAKQSGRGRCEFFSSEVGEGARTRLRVESGLRSAVKNGDLQLHYQPQIDIVSGCVAGVEALLRWHTGEGGWVAPSMFLPIAEESALIDQIGEWVLSRACLQLSAWRQRGLGDLSLSVNVSAHELGQPTFSERIQAQLIEHRLPGSVLVLEITESALLQQRTGHLPVFQRLAALGIQLSLDDFGTGYSSLSHLRQLPLHELKIDRSFVAGMLDQRDDREIVSAIIGLARALGLRIVAEGVETRAQLEQIARFNEPLLTQGWLHTPALPADECEAWIRRWNLETRAHASVPLATAS